MWTDPGLEVRGRGGKGREITPFPWPMGPVMVRGGGPTGMLRMKGAVPHGHARAVWERMAWLVGAAVQQRRLGGGAVDTDLEFLSLVGQHVVGCRRCLMPDPNGGADTAQDFLMRAVKRVPRLARLMWVLERAGDVKKGGGGSGG